MPAVHLERPRWIGRYALFREVARGGMASVHVGRLQGPAGFSRTVAIKRLHERFARDPQFVSMFLDEARLAARIQHPNVVSVLDVVAAEEELFLVMDFVHGLSLQALLDLAIGRGVQVPRRVIVAIMVAVLHGLDAAHEARSERGDPLAIVHRDVSPQNVLIGLDGVARVLDFGVAKAALRVQRTSIEGERKGKLAYMAPEQVAGDDVDRRADIYAAGVVLWEGLTGRRLHNTVSNDLASLLGSIVTKLVEPPSRFAPGTPESVDAIVLKALSRDAHDRYATAEEMAAALERAVPPVTQRQVAEWVSQVAGAELRSRAEEVARIEQAELPARGTEVSSGVRMLGDVEDRTLERREDPTFERKVESGVVALLEDRTLERRDDPTLERPAPPAADTAAARAQGQAAATPRDDDDDEMITIERRPPPPESGPAPAQTTGGAPPGDAPAIGGSSHDGPAPGEPAGDDALRAPVPAAARPAFPVRRGWLLASTIAVVGALVVFTVTRGRGRAEPEPTLARPGLQAGGELTSSPATATAPGVEGSAPELTTGDEPSAEPTHRASRPWRKPRPRTNCSPPYTIDSQGVKIPKRACF